MIKMCEKPNTVIRFRFGDEGDYEQTSGPEFLEKRRAAGQVSPATDWVVEVPE